MASTELGENNDFDAQNTVPKPFRFKQRESSLGNNAGDSSKESSRPISHRRSYRRHKRRKHSHDGDSLNNFHDDAQLAPDVAFRESLFDAMGDDEGAAFWQGVYGQPIHTYLKSYTNPDTGLPEFMDEEQYAKFVRQKMWEKSAEGINSAREARRHKQKEEHTKQERERQQERYDQSQDAEAGPYNNFAFDFEIEASLRRGQRRKDNKRWHEIWTLYQDKWHKLQEWSGAQKDIHANDSEQVILSDHIAWPVESGELKDVSNEQVERFVQHVSNLQLAQTAMTTTVLLKSERIRWHPDKIQQRYGFMRIDEVTMAGVTAVFQILDKLWNERRAQNT